MLTSLSIKNIVLIKELELGFEDGLCVLTGETGAGKSILLDSLGLILGARAESRLVRQNAEQGSVVAEFDIKGQSDVDKILSEHGIDKESNSLLVRRVIKPDGGSKAYVNDTPVSLNFLQDLGELLVEVHGQHDQRGLLNPQNHRNMLDRFAGIEDEVQELSGIYASLKSAEAAFESANRKLQEIKAEEDFLRHSLKELQDMNPVAGEEEELTNKRRMLQNQEKIIETLNSSLSEISGNNNVADRLLAASRILERSSGNLGDLFSPIVKLLDDAAIGAQEASAAIEKMLDGTGLDVGSLEKMEERLFELKALARKHKAQVNDLPQIKADIARKLELFEYSEEELAKLKNEIQIQRDKYKKLADSVSASRKKAAVKMEDLIVKELKPLKMEGAQLKVEIEELAEDKWSSVGHDKINFLVRTNPGSAFGPLNKIASGGELSRFMLAMKVIFSDIKSTPTIVFDEIDTGTGGATADAVGKRLSNLGKKFQVLTITHQPQVAAYGQHHIKVQKMVRNNETVTDVRVLSGKDKMEEVARMLAGAKITEEARAAAGKLMGVE